ncbi:hypothetical protein UlMin_034042 [Ulmus minor]
MALEPLAFVVDKFKEFGNWSQHFVGGLIPRRSETSARRNPIEILKRLQREAFSDLMKLRDRQDKVERVLALYKTAKGSPFQEASTVLRGEVDLLGAFLMMPIVEDQGFDAPSRIGIKTGIDSRFTFETTVRDDKDALLVEFVSGQKRTTNVVEGLGSSLSLAKVLYIANAGDWLSAFAIPVGAQCRDVAFVTDPSHQGKGLTDRSASGPPLLNLHNGSAIGLMVKKSNIVASLAQFGSGLGRHPDSDDIGYCFSTFGQILCQLPGGTKLSLLGLLQVPKLSTTPFNHGPLTIAVGGFKRKNSLETLVEEFSPPMGTTSQGNVPNGSIALMLESEYDEMTKIGGWIELKNSDPKHLQWAVSVSDDSEDSVGWGMRLSGMIEGSSHRDHFEVESYLKLNLGKNFSLKPGIAYAYMMNGKANSAALLLRSSWSL